MNVTCPKCHNITPEDRRIGDKYFCDCGWRFQVVQAGYKPPAHKDKSSLLICLFGFIFLACSVHAISWDKHFFKIIPIKAAQITGLASPSTLADLAKICEERKKYDCVLNSLSELYEKNPIQQLDSLHKKGKLLVRMERYEEAIQSYNLYFKNTGDIPEAHYQFAKALRMEDDIEQASEQYQKALAAKPDILQVSVTRSFVDMLIENKKFEYAKKIINHYRDKAQNTKYFLESELKTVNDALGIQQGRQTSSAKKRS